MRFGTIVKLVVPMLIGLVAGYAFGAWQWRGMAVIESYKIGFDQGYNEGLSTASIPGAEVIGIGPDGKISSRRINP